MKKSLLVVAVFFILLSCEQDNSLKPIEPTKGVIITDLQHDPLANELFQSILTKSVAGRVNNDFEISKIYKYFDLNKDIINYSTLLPDTSHSYFENLVVSKIGTEFYGFILRYVYDEDFVRNGDFKGLIQRYNLDGQLIAEHHYPKDTPRESSNSSGRTMLIYSCIVDYNVSGECISTATGLPIECPTMGPYPEHTVVRYTYTPIYGLCSTPNTGPIQGSGSAWGTPISSEGISGGSIGGYTGSNNGGNNQTDPNNPNVAPNYQSPIAVSEDPDSYRITRQNNFKAGLPYTISTTWRRSNKNLLDKICFYLESQLDDSKPNIIEDYPEELTTFGYELATLASSMNNPEISDRLIDISYMTKIGGYLDGKSFDATFFNYIDPYVDLDLRNQDFHDPIVTYIIVKSAVLKVQHPDWSDAKIYWEAMKDVVHVGLDIFGLIPLLGEPADLTNGLLYTIEGDALNASFSLAATLPIVGTGSTATKCGLKVINAASDVSSKVKLVWKVTANGIDFGSKSQLRKVLGITDTGLQAHHVIPWSDVIKNHDIVQKAAKSDNAFHMNEAINGIPVNSWRNQPNHNAYNTLIQSKLDALPSNLTPNQAYSELTNILNQAKQAISNNPNTHLNDLMF